MKLARILLASATVALLAACGSDPVGPSGTPDRIKPRHLLTVDSTRVPQVDGLDSFNVEQDLPPVCVDTQVVVGGVTTTVQTCDERGSYLGSGH